MNKCVFEGWQLESTLNLFYIKGRIGWKGLKKSEFQDKGPYLITGIHFKKGKIDWNNCFRITEERYEESPEIQVKEDDILITKDGTIGKVAFVESAPEKASLNSHLLLVRAVDERVVPRFAYYVFESESFRSFIELNQSGSTLNGLPQRAFERFELLLPTISEQKKIAAILTSVDDVIEKTQAQIDKLNDLKTGMMQELLNRGVGVDGKPHTEFKDSPVGRIPKGWDCVLMEAICTKITDGEHQTPKRTTEGYYLLSARNVRDGYIDLTNVDYVGGDEFQRISKRVSPKQGDILISCSGSVGRVAVVPPKLEFSMVRSVAILQLNKDIVDPYFMAVQVAATAIQDQIEKSLSQQAQANLFQGAIKKLVVVVPTMPEQKRIASAVNSIANKIAKLQDGLKSKQSLKKALMQDLLTGKKRVKVDS